MPKTQRLAISKAKLNGHQNGNRSLTVIDLFSGAGGLSEGFRHAGFDILAANDADEDAAQTFRAAHPYTNFIDGPIQGITTDHLLAAGGLKKGELDVLIGGPPCQAFSVYNHQRGFHDERSGLFREYLRIVKGLMPKMVVMENVTGITSLGEGQAVTEIHRKLGKLGFHVEHAILKAEEFGIPQQRRRIFFIGSRDAERIEWPEPTYGPAGNLFFRPFVTVKEAIGDLPALNICEGADDSRYTRVPQYEYQRIMRHGADRLYNHVAPLLAEINLKRLEYIKPGGSWRDIPVRLLPAGMKRAKRSDHTKRYGRLHPDGMASTILTKCDLHWGAYIHPSQQRTLTVREAARFQSFPDRFRFYGARFEQFRQVGNAVPPLLAEAVALKVREMLVGTESLALAATV
jgi:DNA (cytosine-5)-methyltransferase 1